MNDIILNILKRSIVHDNSKLLPPEKQMFDIAVGKLKDAEYGTEEYQKCLDELGPALQHHYEHNSHHPEHYHNGVKDMTLLDILEMVADWKAAGERTKDGSLEKSLEVNKERFGISDELFKIIESTAKELNWIK